MAYALGTTNCQAYYALVCLITSFYASRDIANSDKSTYDKAYKEQNIIKPRPTCAARRARK